MCFTLIHRLVAHAVRRFCISWWPIPRAFRGVAGLEGLQSETLASGAAALLVQARDGKPF
jgi:hypothetical protein